MGVKGVATGTVIAELVAAIVGLAIAARHLRGLGGPWNFARLMAPERIRRTIAVNRDIMIRSAALIFVFAWFMAQGARQGDTTLAANAVLMNFIAVAAFFLDGLAFSAEALVGRAIGSGNREGLTAAARMTTWWAAGIAMLASLLFAVLGTMAVDALTIDPAVRASARIYFALGGRFAAGGCVVLPAGRNLYRSDPHRTDAKRHAALAGDFSGRVVDARAVWQPRSVGVVLRSLCGAHRDAVLLLSSLGALDTGVTSVTHQVRVQFPEEPASPDRR